MSSLRFRNHKKQDKDKSSLLSSAANANGNRSTSAPLRPQSAMPPITAPHRFSTQSNTSSTSQNSQQVGMTQSYGVNGAAGVQYQNNNGQLQQPRHQFYAHHNLSSAVARWVIFAIFLTVLVEKDWHYSTTRVFEIFYHLEHTFYSYFENFFQVLIRYAFFLNLFIFSWVKCLSI